MGETYQIKSKTPLPSKCPRCGSGAIKRRDMLHKSGSSTHSGERSFGGISIGLSGKARPRIFAGGSSGHGRRATLRAQEAAPVSYKPAIKALLAFGILSIATPWFLLGVLWGVILLFVAIDDRRAYTQEWWCNKCGGKFRIEKSKLIENDIAQHPSRQSSKKTESEEALGQAASDFFSEAEETTIIPEVASKIEATKQIAPLLPNLDKIERGLKKYCDIQGMFYSTNVANDQNFQRLFNGFYRVRRNKEWQLHFYELLEQSKHRHLDFESVLRKMHANTGNIEASFCSKLIATRFPDQPVIDKYVLKNMGISLPKYNDADRLKKTTQVYKTLENEYKNLLQTQGVMSKIEALRRHFPWAEISDIKALDFVLWQTR
ncbi:MAG: hypothetical protein ABFR47_02045 [Verrucomicrobiota bacterium]